MTFGTIRQGLERDAARAEMENRRPSGESPAELEGTKWQHFLSATPQRTPTRPPVTTATPLRKETVWQRYLRGISSHSEHHKTPRTDRLTPQESRSATRTPLSARSVTPLKSSYSPVAHAGGVKLAPPESQTARDGKEHTKGIDEKAAIAQTTHALAPSDNSCPSVDISALESAVAAMVEIAKANSFCRPMRKVTEAIAKQRLFVTKNMHLGKNIVPRRDLKEILILSYDPVWLLCALSVHMKDRAYLLQASREVDFGAIDSAHDIHHQGDLADFLEAILDRDVLGQNLNVAVFSQSMPEYTVKPGSPRERERAVFNAAVLHRVLSLVFMLDLSKQGGDCLSNRPLFRRDSRYKSSRDVLHAIAKDMLREQGDVIHSLHLMGLSLTHAETASGDVTAVVRKLLPDLSDESPVISHHGCKAAPWSEMRSPPQNTGAWADSQRPVTVIQEQEALPHGIVQRYKLRRDILIHEILESCKFARTLRCPLLHKLQTESNVHIETHGAALVLKMAGRAKLIRNQVTRASSGGSATDKAGGYGASLAPLGLAVVAGAGVIQNYTDSVLASGSALGCSMLAGLGAAAVHNVLNCPRQLITPSFPVSNSDDQSPGSNQGSPPPRAACHLQQQQQPVFTSPSNSPGVTLQGSVQDGIPLVSNNRRQKPTSECSASNSCDRLPPGAAQNRSPFATDNSLHCSEPERSTAGADDSSTFTPYNPHCKKLMQATFLRRVLTELRCCGPSHLHEEVVFQCLRFLTDLCKDDEGPREILAVEESLDVITSTMLAHSDNPKLMLTSSRLWASLANDSAYPYDTLSGKQHKDRLEWLFRSAKERKVHQSIVRARAKRTDILFEKLGLHP